MRLKETQLLVTDSNQNKQKICSSLHLQPLQSCVILHCKIHGHVAPLIALETRVGVSLKWRIQTWTVLVSSCFLLSVSPSLSLSQSVSAPRSFLLSPPPKRHTCVARKSSRRHGNSCQASGEPLLTWPQRRQSAGRADARPPHRAETRRGRRKQRLEYEIMIKGSLREFIKAPASLKMSVQLTPQRYFCPISHQHPFIPALGWFSGDDPEAEAKSSVRSPSVSLVLPLWMFHLIPNFRFGAQSRWC